MGGGRERARLRSGGDATKRARIYGERADLVLCATAPRRARGRRRAGHRHRMEGVPQPGFRRDPRPARQPVIFDGRNLYDPALVKSFGLQLLRHRPRRILRDKTAHGHIDRAHGDLEWSTATFEILITLAVVAGVLVLLTTTLRHGRRPGGRDDHATLLGILKPDQALQGFASSGGHDDRRAVHRRRGTARNRRHGVDIALGARPADSLHGGAEQAHVRDRARCEASSTTRRWSRCSSRSRRSGRRALATRSRTVLPINHIVILAGMCTLIGTSTNLIVNSLLIKDGAGLRGWGSSTRWVGAADYG